MQGKRHQLDCALPNDLLAKKEQFLFYEGRQPIAASIKECLPALISTIVVPSPSTALKIPLVLRCNSSVISFITTLGDRESQQLPFLLRIPLEIRIFNH